MNLMNQSSHSFALSRMQFLPYLLILFCSLIFKGNTLQAQVFAVDENQDGVSPVLISGNSAPPTLQSLTVDDCISIGIVDSGAPMAAMNRLISLGYSDVTLIPPNSGLTEFESFDLLFLPGTWASATSGDLSTIESNAADYISYVEQGGSLYVEQPNPYLQPGSVVTPTILPYPITFYNSYNSGDHPPIIINPNHEILFGLDAEELSIPADQMTVIAPEYEILIIGAITGSASLVVLEYGEGKILVCTSNVNPIANTPMSDQYFLRLIQWLGSSITVDNIQACESYTWLDGITYTSDNNTASVILDGTDGCDSIVNLNLTINFDSSEGVDLISDCGPYTWIDGISYETSNNTASFTLINAGGCDSIVSLDLTITGPDVTISQNGQLLTAGSTGATYQWLECENGFTPIPGATDQNYSVSTDGGYAVIVTQNGCTDTSDCVVVLLNGVDNPLLEKVSIFPNPTDGQLTIDFGQLDQPAVKVYSALGQLVFAKEKIGKRLLEFDLGDVAGVYFVEVLVEGDLKAFRVILE